MQPFPKAPAIMQSSAFPCWHSRNSRVLVFLCLLACCLMFCRPLAAEVTQTSFRRILILNSYHQGYLWTDQITDAVRNQIAPHFQDVEFYIESLDAKRLHSEALTQNLLQNLKLKYRNTRIDIIVTSDDDALLFMRRFHDGLFPGVPVVFCGVNGEENLRGIPRQHFTGLLEVLDVKPNLELIRKLCPETDKIYVVSDSTTTGIALRRLMGDAARDFPDIRFIYLKGEELSTDELIQQLRKLDRTSAVFMNVWFQDKNGSFIAYKDINPMMSRNCPVPIFGMIDMLIDLGIVGGKMNSGKTQGREAGAMALRILKGKATPASMPIITQSRNEYLFDYRQLVRFGIPESALPPGSNIHHRPFSFYEAYKGLVWGVTSIIIVFLVMIITLVINRRKLQTAKAQLIESRRNLAITLDSIDEGVITTDISGSVTSMNPAAERLTGCSIQEAAGKPFDEVCVLYRSGADEPIPSPVTGVIQSGTVTYLDSFSLLLTQDQQKRHVADSCSPIRDEENRIQGAVVVLRDATEEFALQEKLRQSEKLRSVGELAGGIAHDFNNVLMGISGAAEILESETSEEGKRFLNIIRDAARRAASLTSRLLIFSRKKQLVMAPVDTHALLNHTASLLSHTVDKKIIIQIKNEAPLSIITGDDSQLQNAVLNLGINASHAMPDGGSLDFSTRNVFLDQGYCEASPFDLTPGDFIEVEVRDTGVGIPPENLRKVFEPFFTTKEQGKGTGLGLSAVYGTIQSHSGAINLYSEPGKGTVFHIYLPLATGASPETHPEMEVCHRKACILVIDDEDMIRSTLQAMLESLGHQVLTASDGLEGLDSYRAKAASIDLVILDMIMPRMNGRETLEELRKINPELRILISSGFSRGDEVRVLQSKGRCDFIRKPYIRQELIAALNRLMD